MSTLKTTGVDDDMGSGLVLDGKDGEIGASYSLLHLYHQGRGHSPCHHQLQHDLQSGHGNVRIIFRFMLFIFNIQLF